MAAQNRSFLDELVAAARGCVALLVGDRRAPDHFDFSRRGVYGGVIALLIALAAQTYLPLVLGIPTEPGMISRTLLINVFLIFAQLTATVLVLRQLKRLDALAPYIATSGWVSFFSGIVLITISVLGLGNPILLFGVLIAFLVLEVNTARLVMTLSPLQIGILLFAQLIGVVIGLLVIALLVPLPPELAAEVNAAFNQ